jgi:mono/diheme cytochrome c family protein
VKRRGFRLLALLVVLTLSAAFLWSAGGLRAQGGAALSTKRSVWSGVYTSEQAARGKEEYEKTCAGCHGPEFGGGDGPPLVGEPFLRNWIEDDVSNLVEKVHQRMPGDNPGSLSMQQASDLVAFLFEANGFPSGPTEMASDSAALSAIRIQDKAGPGPVPNFALVLVAGCLTQTADGQWTLTTGSEPVRTRESAPNARAPGATLPALGTQTFKLLDVAPLRPQNAAGHLIEAKGLLMRQPAGTAINVTSIQSVAPRCP